MRNNKVVVYSLIALACMAAMVFVDWMFIIPAAILSWLGWKELTKK